MTSLQTSLVVRRRPGRAGGDGCACGLAAEPPSWCGPKKATLALLDGFGGNSWRQVTTASGKQTARTLPQHHQI